MEQHQDKIKLFENIVKTHQKKVETNEQKLRFNRTLAMFEKPPTKVSPSKGKYICAICNFGENIFQKMFMVVYQEALKLGRIGT